MGKWTEIAKGLPKRLEDSGAFQVKVQELKDQARLNTLDELAAAYRQVRKEKAVLETVEAELNARAAALEQLLGDVFRATERGIPYSFSDGSRVEVSDQISVRCADADALLDWMKANGYERMLSVNPKRLEGLTKAALEAGSATPDGVAISAYQQVKLVLRG